MVSGKSVALVPFLSYRFYTYKHFSHVTGQFSRVDSRQSEGRMKEKQNIQNSASFSSHSNVVLVFKVAFILFKLFGMLPEIKSPQIG